MLSPMNILELNKTAWNAIGGQVASPYINQPKYRQMFEALCEKLNRGARVLDVGCGPGIPIAKLLVDIGFDVTGLDFAEEMIALARKNAPGASFVCASVTDMSYEDSFDGVVASYSLLCLDPVRFCQAAKKIATALKPGGYCFLSLNESLSPAEPESESIIEVSGQRMYSRAYSERDIREGFWELDIISLEREVVHSAMFGTERSIIVLLKKQLASLGGFAAPERR